MLRCETDLKKLKDSRDELNVALLVLRRARQQEQRRAKALRDSLHWGVYLLTEGSSESEMAARRPGQRNWSYEELKAAADACSADELERDMKFFFGGKGKCSPSCGQSTAPGA